MLQIKEIFYPKFFYIILCLHGVDLFATNAYSLGIWTVEFFTAFKHKNNENSQRANATAVRVSGK